MAMIPVSGQNKSETTGDRGFKSHSAHHLIRVGILIIKRLRDYA
ncbi:MAG: hypothetical protein ACFFCM_03030 [Promethearchaeota archaeon]